MCGIAGVLTAHRAPHRLLLTRMATLLRHRGPDSEYIWIGAGLGLAVRRLSIVNLAEGHQPAVSNDGQVVAILNGEIFNHIELRACLEKEGLRVPPGSDAAVLPAAYQHWGENFVAHLNGDFAIAIWSAPERTLRLYRDRAGVRPLYYTYSDDGDFVFASEVKALFAHDRVPRALSPAALAQIASYWSTVDGTSAFKNVSQVPAGCYAVVPADRNSLRICRYWDIPFRPIAPRSATADETENSIAQFRALLADAVRLRLRADVEVATYTSGGIDSAIVNLIAAGQGRRVPRTFSMAFEDPVYDEGPYQRLVAKHLGLPHTELVCRLQDIYDYFPKAVFHAEQPLFRTAPVPMLMLSEAVRAAGIKVVMTGEGADEVAWGYDLFQEAHIRRFWSRQPNSTWRPRLLRRLYSYMPQFQNPRLFDLSLDFFRGDLENVSDPLYPYHTRIANSRATHDYFHPDVKAAIAATPPTQALVASLPTDFASRSLAEKCQYLEMKTLLSGYLLASQGDRMQSANSVEGRFPYLDHRLIEMLADMPPNLKLRQSQGKWILRNSYVDQLPSQTLQRPKFAYRAPGIEAFVGDGAGYVEAALSPDTIASAGLFDATRVQALWKKIRVKKTGFTTREQLSFTQILSTQLLFQMYCHNDVRPITT
jgi:asparagine synthase (glutamine-hydrolysing)